MYGRYGDGEGEISIDSGGEVEGEKRDIVR